MSPPANTILCQHDVMTGANAHHGVFCRHRNAWATIATPRTRLQPALIVIQCRHRTNDGSRCVQIHCLLLLVIIQTQSTIPGTGVAETPGHILGMTGSQIIRVDEPARTLAFEWTATR